MTATITLPEGYIFNPSGAVDISHAIPRAYEVLEPYWLDDTHEAIYCKFRYPSMDVFAIVNKILTDGTINPDFDYIVTTFSEETIQRNTEGVREKEIEDNDRFVINEKARREEQENNHLRSVKIDLLELPEVKISRAYDLKAKIKGSNSVAAACAYAGALIAWESMRSEATI